MKKNLPAGQRLSLKRSLDNRPSKQPFDLHAHEHYELLLFLSGDITYLVEGCLYHPKQGDILIFNIAETHKVIVNSDMPYERLVIEIDKTLLQDFDIDGKLIRSFGNRKPGEANIIHAENFTDDFWLKCIEHLPNNTGAEHAETLTVLFFLLREIAKARENAPRKPEEIPFSSQIVRYINTHITEDITPSVIAEHFFISRTALYALFRETTGSCIHEYITLKRLMMARELLAAGEQPTCVYLKCGFKDYSTFYRAYKKRFSESPAALGKHA